MTEAVISWSAKFRARLVEIVQIALDAHPIGDLRYLTGVPQGMPPRARINDARKTGLINDALISYGVVLQVQRLKYQREGSLQQNNEMN